MLIYSGKIPKKDIIICVTIQYTVGKASVKRRNKDD